jgi:hypothetical protein
MSNKHHFTQSSSIAHCDYLDADGKMHIGFQSGHTYEYECDKSVYEGLKAAKSAGEYFHRFIRVNYKGKKI